MAIKDLIVTGYVKTYPPVKAKLGRRKTKYKHRGKRMTAYDAIRICGMFLRGASYQHITKMTGWGLTTVKSVNANPKPYTAWDYTQKQRTKIKEMVGVLGLPTPSTDKRIG